MATLEPTHQPPALATTRLPQLVPNSLPHAHLSRTWLIWTLLFGITFVLMPFDGVVYDWCHQHWNVNTRPVPEVLRLPTRFMRSADDWGENYYITMIVLAIWRMDRKNRSIVIGILVASLIVHSGVEVAKRSTGRLRPDVTLGKQVWFGPTRWHEGGDAQSFPSGHTASAGTFAGILAATYPPARPALIVLTVGCGASRVWKERHFLSDVWLGGVFGFFIGCNLPRNRYYIQFLANLQSLWWHIRWYFPKTSTTDATA